MLHNVFLLQTYHDQGGNINILRIGYVATILIALTGCLGKSVKTNDLAHEKSETISVNRVFSQSFPRYEHVGTSSPQAYNWRTDRVTSIAASDDGRFVASGTVYGNSVILWSAKNQKPLVEFTLTKQKKFDLYDAPTYSGLVFSPDSKYLAFGSHNNIISIWDINKNNIHRSIKVGHLITALSFSPDGKNIVYANNSYEVSILKIADSKNVATFKHSAIVNIVSYAKSGKRLVTAAQNKHSINTRSISIWNTANKQLVKTIRLKGQVSSLAISPDDEIIVALLFDKNKSMLAAWNLEGTDVSSLAGFEVHDASTKWTPHTNTGYGIDFSADGKTIVSGVEGNMLNIWDVKTRVLVKRITTMEVGDSEIQNVIFVNNDDEIITTGVKGRAIRLWSAEGKNVETGEAVVARIKLAAKKVAERGNEIKSNNINRLAEVKIDAERGQLYAQYQLARCYHRAFGYDAPTYCPDKNFAESLKWYRKAAEQGHSRSQAELGRFYLVGYGVQKNYAEAGKWLRKAADQGDAYAVKDFKKIEHKVQISNKRKKLKDDIKVLINKNPKFKRCYGMVNERLTTCRVSIGNCDIVGCGKNTTCDRTDGRLFNVHPCERRLNLNANELGTYYCDVETVEFSKDKDRVIMNECTY